MAEIATTFILQQVSQLNALQNKLNPNDVGTMVKITKIIFNFGES